MYDVTGLVVAPEQVRPDDAFGMVMTRSVYFFFNFSFSLDALFFLL